MTCNIICIKCSKSLKQTVHADKTNAMPNCNMYCITKIIGKKITYFVNPNPYNKQNAIIIIVDIKKFTIALVTMEIGSISRGKYTFFTIFPFAIMVYADCEIEAVKNVHGINPTHTNIT